MFASSTVDGRLMCASACAYFVNLSGDFVVPGKSDPNYNLYVYAGFLGHVQAFTNKSPLEEKINAAILAETDLGYVLAFRGTLPFKKYNCASWEDWLQDIIESDTINTSELPGEVHQGIFDAYQSICGDIMTALHTIYVDNKSNKPLLITGHSKGGPMASYAAYITKCLNFPVTKVVTFASPHPGNVTFAEGYNKVIAQTRYENYLDIVPFLPPAQQGMNSIFLLLDGLIDFFEWAFPGYAATLKKFKEWLNEALKWNYFPVGTLKYITKEGRIVGDSVGLEYLRLDEFVTDIYDNGFEKGLQNIAAAHSIGCGSGYQKGVIPSVC